MRERRACVVHEHALANDVALSHGRRRPRLPAAVELAELAVAIAIGMEGAVLLPQQLQRHPWPPQLGGTAAQFGGPCNQFSSVYIVGISILDRQEADVMAIHISDPETVALIEKLA